MLDKLKNAFNAVRSGLSRKLIYVAVSYALVALSKAHPDWPLPDANMLTDWLLFLLGAHTLTDVAAIVKSYAAHLAEERRAAGKQP